MWGECGGVEVDECEWVGEYNCGVTVCEGDCHEYVWRWVNVCGCM